MVDGGGVMKWPFYKGRAHNWMIPLFIRKMIVFRHACAAVEFLGLFRWFSFLFILFLFGVCVLMYLTLFTDLRQMVL